MEEKQQLCDMHHSSWVQVYKSLSQPVCLDATNIRFYQDLTDIDKSWLRTLIDHKPDHGDKLISKFLPDWVALHELYLTLGDPKPIVIAMEQIRQQPPLEVFQDLWQHFATGFGPSFIWDDTD